MLDIILVIAFLGGLGWVAARAFMRPDGIYRKSLIGFAGAIAVAAGVWIAASPFIANEAGLGALVVFLMVVAGAGIVAAVACMSATVRHVMDALAR